MTSTGSSSVASHEPGNGRVVAAVLITLITVIAVAESDAAPKGIRDAYSLAAPRNSTGWKAWMA